MPLCIAMVGLPARGKSTVAKKLKENISHEHLNIRVFNNGELRRQIIKGDSARPDFYDPDNTEASAERERIAQVQLNRAHTFLDDDGDIAILDATNVTKERRDSIIRRMHPHPVLFIECRNDDDDLLSESIKRKTKLSEFGHLTFQEAYEHFLQRIELYRKKYVPVNEGNYLILDSLDNKITDQYLQDQIPYYVLIRDALVTDWVNTLFIVRHGQTHYNLQDRIGGDSALTDKGHEQANQLGDHFKDTIIPLIFTGQRQRTIETATPIKRLQRKARIISLPEFNEIDAGICERMSYAEIKEKYPDLHLKRMRDKYHFVYPEGEGYQALYERVKRGLKKALFLSGTTRNIMIVGHQAVNRAILAYFLYRREQDVPYIYVPQHKYYHISSTQSQKSISLKPFYAKKAP